MESGKVMRLLPDPGSAEAAPEGSSKGPDLDALTAELVNDTLSTVVEGAREAAGRMLERARLATEQQMAEADKMWNDVQQHVAKFSAWQEQIDPLVEAANDHFRDIRARVAKIPQQIDAVMAPVTDSVSAVVEIMAQIGQTLDWGSQDLPVRTVADDAKPEAPTATAAPDEQGSAAASTPAPPVAQAAVKAPEAATTSKPEVVAAPKPETQGSDTPRSDGSSSPKSEAPKAAPSPASSAPAPTASAVAVKTEEPPPLRDLPVHPDEPPAPDPWSIADWASVEAEPQKPRKAETTGSAQVAPEAKAASENGAPAKPGTNGSGPGGVKSPAEIDWNDLPSAEKH